MLSELTLMILIAGYDDFLRGVEALSTGRSSRPENERGDQAGEVHLTSRDSDLIANYHTTSRPENLGRRCHGVQSAEIQRRSGEGAKGSGRILPFRLGTSDMHWANVCDAGGENGTGDASEELLVRAFSVVYACPCQFDHYSTSAWCSPPPTQALDF